MANKDHLEILRQGIDVWNEWRKDNRQIIITDFREVNLIGANLEGADFTGVDFSGANLKGANIQRGSLTWATAESANFEGANLTEVNFGVSNFNNANLIRANIAGAKLSGTNLKGAKLNDANLLQATLYDAKLEEADLSGACLVRTQAHDANFNKATLTGVCIEDWNTNSYTNLNEVNCDYIYLRWEFSKKERKRIPAERCPFQGNFAPGEFTKRYQKYRDTFDWVFHHGVNWVALAYSFKLEWERKGTDIKIKGIEEIDDGVIRIRVKVPLEADKGTVETRLKQDYHKFKAIVYKQQGELREKDKQINLLSRKIDHLFELSLSRPSNQTTIFQGEIMPDKRSDIKIGDVGGSIGAFAGGDISGVAGQNMTGVAGGDISGTVTNTISELKASDDY
jgi:uncharacterized protein YjbI with pentapeptide repeats